MVLWISAAGKTAFTSWKCLNIRNNGFITGIIKLFEKFWMLEQTFELCDFQCVKKTMFKSPLSNQWNMCHKTLYEKNWILQKVKPNKNLLRFCMQINQNVMNI